jgi:hypothetical protein
LFYRRDQVDLDAVLRHQADQLRSAVDALPDTTFAEKSDADIAAQVATSVAFRPLEVNFEAAVADVREVQVEVHDRFGFERGPIKVAGLRATKTIPFKGNPELWTLRTNPYNMNPPRGEVRGQTLVIGIDVPAQQVDEASRYIEDTLNSIPEYLDRQRAQIEAHNASLANRALPTIQQRRARLSQAADLLRKLQG